MKYRGGNLLFAIYYYYEERRLTMKPITDLSDIEELYSYISNVPNVLRSGDPSPAEDQTLFMVLNSLASWFLSKQGELCELEVNTLGCMINICNIIYNNMPIDDDCLFVDNGVYDLLLEKYRYYCPNVQVGAEPIVFKYQPRPAFIRKNTIQLVQRMDVPDDNIYYDHDLYPNIPINGTTTVKQLVSYLGSPTGKKLRISGHEYPELVGTLMKCKFVLDSQAEEAGVLDDPKVKVLERDFFADHIKKGIINPNAYINMIATLKYDGISMVVTVKDRMVRRAISRGDTGLDAAVDYTSIFYGYIFPDLHPDIELEIKCEAVMTYRDLAMFNEVRGYDYKNARSAIIGLTSLNDGYLYRDFVTLVPIKVVLRNEDNDQRFDVPTLRSILDNRYQEIEFINTFLVTKEYLRWAIIEGDLTSVLFQIKKFVEEAEHMRPYMNCMYDGVVVEYTDKRLIDRLGRENYINKYQMAIKFSTLKRLTKLLAITFTVGQNGVITPMAHYQPIEFLGSCHTKSSISSVARFNENQFKIGNIIQVEYINDVMPYVTTPPGIEENINNPNPVLEFIKTCPECGTELIISGKSAICPCMTCRGRTIARMANMMDKLGIKGFAEQTMKKLEVNSLRDLASLDYDTIIARTQSPDIANRLITAMEMLKTTKLYDYIIIGALGFSNIAQGTWKIIFNHITIQELIDLYSSGNDLAPILISIKGIGANTANTIMNEMSSFIDDIKEIISWGVIIDSQGIVQKKIRITGIRDQELMDKLNEMGYDASDKGATRDTFILLVPNEGYTSSKMNKIGPDTKVIPLEEFKNNMDKYLSCN